MTLPPAALKLCTSPPTFWCSDTKRVIQELAAGGWACYKAPQAKAELEDKFTIEGERVGVVECYSHASRWMFGQENALPEFGQRAGKP